MKQIMNKRLRKNFTKRLLVSPMTDNLNWAAVLRSEPESVAKCPVLSKFDGVIWWWILTRQPQLDHLCNWRRFNGWDWAFLLGFMPQYADKCRWEKLAGRDWCLLLFRQPQFAKYCDVEKLGYYDCKKLLEPASPVDDITKEKIAERCKKFKYILGHLDGHELSEKKSQCGNCRFHSCLYDCLYYPMDYDQDWIPSEYWMNDENCPHRSVRNGLKQDDVYNFAIKYAGIFQNVPSEIQCSAFFAEMLLLGFEYDYSIWSYDCQKIYDETDIAFVTSVIFSQWWRTGKTDFKWFADSLLHLAELTGNCENK